MNPMLSFFIAIISLMPAIIFVVFFKILLTILNRGKRKFNEDFHEEGRNLNKSKNSFTFMSIPHKYLSHL